MRNFVVLGSLCGKEGRNCRNFNYLFKERNERLWKKCHVQKRIITSASHSFAAPRLYKGGGPEDEEEEDEEEERGGGRTSL